MLNTCKNTLNIKGEGFEVEKFLNDFHLFKLGFRQLSRSESSISFESDYSPPIRRIVKESELYSNLTFTLVWDELTWLQTCGIVIIKNGEILRNEESDETSLLAREILGDSYVDDIINKYKLPIIQGLERKDNLLKCLTNHIKIKQNDYKYVELELKINQKGSLFSIDNIISLLSNDVEVEISFNASCNAKDLEDNFVRYSLYFFNEEIEVKEESMPLNFPELLDDK